MTELLHAAAIFAACILGIVSLCALFYALITIAPVGYALWFCGAALLAVVALLAYIGL